MKKFAGIVVVYNPDGNIISNIKSYIEELGVLYIVDNSNTNDFFRVLKQELLSCDYEYIPLYENKGLAYALDVGARRAYKNGYEWLLTMDQDSRFETPILSIYQKYIESEMYNNDVAIISPQYDTPRSNVVLNSEILEIGGTMQSANLINLSIYEQVGGFELKYFIDCIDYEYCMRVLRKGYKIIRCNEAVLKHSPAENKKIALVNVNYGYTSPLRIYYQVRNALDMYSKYHNLESLGIIVVKLIKILILFDSKLQYIKYFKCALYDFKHNIFGKKEENSIGR